MDSLLTEGLVVQILLCLSLSLCFGLSAFLILPRVNVSEYQVSVEGAQILLQSFFRAFAK